MTKHTITVRDGDIVELVPQRLNSTTEQDTAGYAAHPQPIPGSVVYPDFGRVRVIVSCPPLPRPPVPLQDDEVQAFMMNKYAEPRLLRTADGLPVGGGAAAPLSWAFEFITNPVGTFGKHAVDSLENL